MRRILCLCLGFLAISACAQSENVTDPACGTNSKSVASLIMAKESIVKAKESFPNCTSVHTNSSTPGCDLKQKSSGYLDVALNLITYALRNYPTCVDTGDDRPEIKNKTGKYAYPMDCSQVQENGHNTSGVYAIWLSGGASTRRRVEVFCDMSTTRGGWTVIQRRGKFSVREDFYRDWAAYRQGFGNITQEFWLGNDNIYALSNQGSYSIRFDLEDEKGVKGYAVYNTFRIESESTYYKLQIENYSGTVGDAMKETHNGKKFSTKDKKNDGGCGSQDCPADMKGGFWYGHGGGYCCYGANPNGQYEPKGSTSSITWIPWRDYGTMNAVEMKLKRI